MSDQGTGEPVRETGSSIDFVEEPGQVRVRVDRPGVAAVSHVMQPEELLRKAAEAAGYTVVDNDAGFLELHPRAGGGDSES